MFLFKENIDLENEFHSVLLLVLGHQEGKQALFIIAHSISQVLWSAEKEKREMGHAASSCLSLSPM